MASIQRYFDFDRQVGTDADLREACYLLLTKISETAAIADESACLDFQANMRRLAEVCREGETPEQILRTTNAAMQLLSDYSNEVTVSIRRQQRALANVIRTTAETAASLIPDNPVSAEDLRTLADQLSSGGAGANFDELNQVVADCLQTFRQEILRQREEGEHLIVSLRRDIERGPQQVSQIDNANVDPATSLPQKDACTRAIHSSLGAGKRRFVTVFVFGRLRGINLKFGREIGDRVLCRLGEFIEQQILPTDRLFRWDGPTLVAVMDRNDTLERIRSEVQRMMASKIDETLNIDGRPVTIPISAAWSAFQLLTTVTSVEKQIDTFAVSQGLPPL